MSTTVGRLLTTVSVLALGLGAGAVSAGDLITAPVLESGLQPVEMGRTISGTATIYGSYSALNGSNGQPDVRNPLSLGGDARIDIPLSDYYSLQLDKYGEALFGNDPTSTEDYTGGFLAGAHINYRDPDRYLFGVFGGVGQNYGGSSTTDSPNLQWLVGVEGQYYMGNTTFYGQVGFSDARAQGTSQNELQDAFFLRGVARHYLNAGNTKLEGEFGWASGFNEKATPSHTTDAVDVFSWGVEVEHTLRSYGADGFLSGFARYEGYSYLERTTGGGTDSGTAHIFKLGVRMDLNQTNPFSRERNGVAVDILNASRLNGHARLVQ